jgi:hypothetical protein
MRMLYDDLMETIINSAHKDLLFPLLNDFDELAHWISVVTTRNHGVGYE